MSRRAHFPLLALLAAALFLRALVPAGWMPAPANGVFAIEPCPAADGFIGHHPGHHGEHKAQHDGDCAFAPLHAGFAPASAPVTIVNSTVVAELPLATAATPSYPTGPPAPPPPATGPPAIA